MLSFLQNDPYTKFCPYHGCDGYVSLIEEGELTDDMRGNCPKCGGEICPQCGAKEHRFGDNPISCNQQATVTKEDAKIDIDSKTRRRLRHMGVQACPNCGMAIVRTTGCPDMICTGCQTNFKWKGDPGETTFEKVAFFYPRIVKYLFTSREAHSEGFGAQLLLGGVASVI